MHHEWSLFKGFYKLIGIWNHRNTNKIHKSEERTILRKWIKIKVDLPYIIINIIN